MALAAYCIGCLSPNSDLRQCNMIIKHQVLDGNLNGAILTYKKMMIEAGSLGDNFTFPHLLKAAARLSSLHIGVALHGQTIKTGYSVHAFVQTALVNMYSALGYIEEAHKLFEKMSQKDLVAWNSVLDAYASRGQMDAAVKLFDLMPVKDPISFNIMISGYGDIGMTDSAWDTFCEIPVRNIASWNSMITAYAKAGKMDSACRLFDKMPERNVVSWNTMISGYLLGQCYTDVVDLFDKMKVEKIEPNHVTLVSVLSACAQMGSLETGTMIHAQAMGFSLNHNVVTALIDMYSKCGSIERALRVFFKSQMKDIYSWNAIISGLALHGYCYAAYKLFDDMKSKGIRPDDITFIGLLSGCSHAGLVQEGCDLFDLMETEFGVSPKAEHYGCMVDLLGRSGFLDRAYALVEAMPFEPGATVLGALLGACVIHGDLEMGEIIAKRLTTRIDHLSDGEYMMLANMYASCGQWDEAKRWREMMIDAGIVKTAGSSMIEIKGKMHKFLAGDNTY